MPATNVAAHISKYSRIPAGPQIARSATAEIGHVVNFVLLDDERAAVLASGTGTTRQIRPLSPAEQALLTGTSIERTSDSTAVRVELPDTVHAALSVSVGLDEPGQQSLQRLAHELSQAVSGTLSEKSLHPQFEAAILAGLRDAVIVLGPDMSVIWSNPGVVPLLGWGPSEIVGRHFASLIHPDDLGRAIEAASSMTTGHRLHRLHLRIANAYDSWVPVSMTGFDHTQNPDIGGIVLSIRNNDQLESKRALDETRRISSTILQNLNEAVIAADDVGKISIINDAARELFGIDPDVAAGSLSIDDIEILNWRNERLGRSMHPLRKSPDWFDQELRVQTPMGVRHLTVNRTEVQLDESPLGIVVTFHDITQARADARELRDRALHDQLTGLANRRFLAEKLQAFETQNDTRLAACFVDIDKFKTVNDVHGHRVGDAVLKKAADRLRTQTRGDDFLARTGGDEFLILLANPDSEAAAHHAAERIRRAFEAPFDVEGIRLHLTVSVGLAFQEGGSFQDERILRHADIALYAAKEAGRDRTEIFDQALAVNVALEQDRRALVQDALDTGRVEMHFQAIVNSDADVIGIEALARIRDRAGNVVAPGEFLDAIDGTNLMVRLDKEGFRQACHLGAILQSNPATDHVWVASNFSAITLAQPDFADVILQTIKFVGVAPHTMCVEVTETAAFEPGLTCIAALNDLRAAGLGIALDDFGTGYSSLSHLRDLPLTTVKIDRSFTSKLHENGAERAIASAVREIAVSLGFDVVAEGVATEVDCIAAQEIGVNSLQGWYFAKPVPEAELLRNLGLMYQIDLPLS